ncbi:MAG: NAD-dependent epimerase/dehydratase family protein [Vulcanimicrobiaceae bacterium]
MDVLIIGATGYVGTALDESLKAQGHRTVGVVRSDMAKFKLQARGTAFVKGDAAKPQSLIEPAKKADAVVYCPQITDADAHSVGLNALRAIARALAGTEKTFVYTSSAWVYGSTGGTMATEDSQPNPPGMVARRLELERMTLNMTKIGIRGLVVRPGIAYGRGAGIPAMFVQSARERRAATMVGDGSNRWATIAVEDLGDLMARVLVAGRPGRAYNAINDDTYTVNEIAEAASRGAGAGGATALVPADILGPFGECLTLDQRISAERAKADLGWSPQALSLPEELEFGSYLAAALASLGPLEARPASPRPRPSQPRQRFSGRSRKLRRRLPGEP